MSDPDSRFNATLPDDPESIVMRRVTGSEPALNLGDVIPVIDSTTGERIGQVMVTGDHDGAYSLLSDPHLDA